MVSHTRWFPLLSFIIAKMIDVSPTETYPSRMTCDSNKDIYDIFQYKCISCKDSIRLDSQSCTCPNSSKIVSRKNRISVNCTRCGESENMVSTHDKLNCINISKDPCGINGILVDYHENGTLFDQQSCVNCTDNTEPNEEKNKCIPCPKDPLNPSVSLCAFECFEKGYEAIDGECFPSTKLLPNNSDFHLMKYKGYGSFPQVNSKILHFFRKIQYKCKYLEDRQSCSFLHNLCVLQMFDDSTQGPCKSYAEVTRKETNIPSPPSLDVAKDASITGEYSFLHTDPKSHLMLKIARYSLYGDLIDIENASLNSLQICQSTCDYFRFGKWHSNKCSIRAAALFNARRTEFYELFLEYEKGKMIPVPVSVKYLDEDSQIQDTKKSVRRFFLVDNQSGIDINSVKNLTSVIQYAKSVELSIQLSNENPGRISVPILTITYACAKDIFSERKLSDLHFQIIYQKSTDKLESDISIALGVFSAFAIIFAAVQTWSWCKRSGKLAIDFFVLIKFILYLCSQLANVFLIVMFFVSFLFLLFYKNQSYAVMVLPTKDQESVFENYIIAAFCLKCFDMIHVLYTLINIDIFFVDWERPRLPRAPLDGITQEQSDSYPVSIWRSYFVANEWNKLKIQHKTNTLINLISVIFFLKLLKLEELALAEPDSERDPDCFSPFSQICRFALVVLVFFISALIQFIVKNFFYEKFIIDSRLNQLKDMCSVANISIFVLMYRQYGFYIHGRSVHGHADVDMKTFNEHLKREEENLCGLRGLLPNTTLQTFAVFITRDFSTQYYKIKFYNRNLRGKFRPTFSTSYSSHTRNKNMPSYPIERIIAYQTMNKFLSSFIDHAIQDLDYIVKDKTVSEKIIDLEFEEPAEKSFFYNDHRHSVQHTMLSGHETTFLVWEILCIALLDIILQDFLFSVFITALLLKILEFIYSFCSRRYVIMNSLLDVRFLPS